MRIVADADILSVKDSFAALGELELLPGREIRPHHVRDADILLVRSITRVDEALLSGSRVMLVGSATSGVDHVDTRYLMEQGIAFFSASGSNANAVVDYCLTALALLSLQRGRNLYSCNAAVVGAGNVGGLLARKLVRLGIQCTVHDPLLTASAQSALRAEGVTLGSLNDALEKDIVSLHVPLTLSGEYATWHLVSSAQLQLLNQDSFLLNTSRGAVVDGEALKSFLAKRKDVAVALDVWEGEPHLDQELLARVALGTPHIAGYSVEAKRRATEQMKQQIYRHLGIAPEAGSTGKPASDPVCRFSVEDCQQRQDQFCTTLLAQVLPLSWLDAQLRREFIGAGGRGAQLFDSLRKELSGRREYAACRLANGGLTSHQRRFLEVLGMGLSSH